MFNAIPIILPDVTQVISSNGLSVLLHDNRMKWNGNGLSDVLFSPKAIHRDNPGWFLSGVSKDEPPRAPLSFSELALSLLDISRLLNLVGSL